MIPIVSVGAGLIDGCGGSRAQEATGRVARFELVPLEKLGRPRVDVLCNMSGIFRDRCLFSSFFSGNPFQIRRPFVWTPTATAISVSSCAPFDSSGCPFPLLKVKKH